MSLEHVPILLQNEQFKVGAYMNFRVYVQVPASITQLFIFFLVLFSMIIDMFMVVILCCAVFLPTSCPLS